MRLLVGLIPSCMLSVRLVAGNSHCHKSLRLVLSCMYIQLKVLNGNKNITRLHKLEPHLFEARLNRLGNRMPTFLFSFVQMGYELLTTKEAPTSDHQPGKQAPSRHFIGIHFSSLKLHLTLNVNVKCRTEFNIGLDEHGKLLTRKASFNI